MIPILKTGRAALLALSLSMTPLTAVAFDTAEAEALTQLVVDDMLDIVTSGAGDQAQIDRFEAVMDEYADISAIARYALGVAWRSASAQQQAAYTAAFQSYLANKYSEQFDNFSGQTMQIVRSVDAGNRGIVVNTRIVGGSEPVAVDFQFSDRSGRPRLVDIIVEGISLLTTERQEIGGMLDRRNGDLDRLIADLNG